MISYDPLVALFALVLLYATLVSHLCDGETIELNKGGAEGNPEQEECSLQKWLEASSNGPLLLRINATNGARGLCTKRNVEVIHFHFVMCRSPVNPS